jgi:predicted amidohydrolase
MAEREKLDNQPLLVVGSHHAEDRAGHRRNTSWAVVGRGGRLEHHKFERFAYRCDRIKAQRVEDIRTDWCIRIFCGNPWSVSLLICRDALSEPVQHLLRELRINLLLVPAFSTKTPPFIALAESLANANQAFVVVANGPVPQDRVVGIFGTPRSFGASITRSGARSLRRGTHSASLACYDEGEHGSLPILCIFDVSTGQLEFLRC